MWLLFLLLAPAQATWSIVAADSTTGEIGGAGTSCVGELDVSVIFGGAPGKGAVHAQAQLNVEGRDEAVRLLTEGATPLAVVQAITESRFDPAAARRQYAVVDLSGRSAAYTGDSNGDWAGDVQGNVRGIVYSAQGNILTGEAVVSRTASSFKENEACDLPERLLVALTAGREEGEGDSRCTERGVPSDSAFLRVEDAAGTALVDLSVTGTGSQDPLDLLRAEFDQWRQDNPCPIPESDGTDDTEAPTEARGCGCTTQAPVGGALVLALVMWGVFGRRRRSP